MKSNMEVKIRSYTGRVLKMDSYTDASWSIENNIKILAYDVTLLTDDAIITIKTVLPSEIRAAFGGE